jgi:hypothetical protein
VSLARRESLNPANTDAPDAAVSSSILDQSSRTNGGFMAGTGAIALQRDGQDNREERAQECLLGDHEVSGGTRGGSGQAALIWPGDATAEATQTDSRPTSSRPGDRSDQGVAARDQPDGVTARAGAGHLHAVRAARRLPGRDGLGGRPPLPVLSARSAPRLMGAVGLVARRDVGRAAAAPRRAVLVRIRTVARIRT